MTALVSVATIRMDASVDVTGGSISLMSSVAAPAVPVPDSLWLLGSSMAGLLGFRRKGRA